MNAREIGRRAALLYIKTANMPPPGGNLAMGPMGGMGGMLAAWAAPWAVPVAVWVSVAA